MRFGLVFDNVLWSQPGLSLSTDLSLKAPQHAHSAQCYTFSKVPIFQFVVPGHFFAVSRKLKYWITFLVANCPQNLVDVAA